MSSIARVLLLAALAASACAEGKGLDPSRPQPPRIPSFDAAAAPDAGVEPGDAGTGEPDATEPDLPPPPPPFDPGDRLVLHGQPARIMPLGDSITSGNPIRGEVGYRLRLHERLTEDGHAFDFVGSINSGSAALRDRDHEGHDGWLIQQLRSQVSAWVTAHRPDVVLLLAGTFDADTGNEPLQAPQRVRALLEALVAADPALRVVVTTLPPVADDRRQPFIDAFNAELPGIVSDLRDDGDHVRLVDAASVVSESELSADGIHPTLDGYRDIADAFYTDLSYLLSLE